MAAVETPVQAQKTGLAALAYVLTWLTGLIVFLVAQKDDKFTRFHALQAIGFGVLVVIVYVVASIVAGLPGLFFLMTIVWLAVLVGIILLAVMAYQGKKFKLPLIGGLAEKNA